MLEVKPSVLFSYRKVIFFSLLDSAAHPILQCTFPEASAMNHKSACTVLSRGGGTAIGMRPIDLCEDTLAKQREMKYSWLTL